MEKQITNRNMRLILSCLALSSSHTLMANTMDTSILPEIVVTGQKPLMNNIGQSRLNEDNIHQKQADNLAELLDMLPSVSMSGSPRPGGQSLNIWGFGDSEDVKITLDGAPKNFEKYRQGSVFVEPELLKTITVNKGVFDVSKGNGGFGGSVSLETKDAADLLEGESKIGGFVKISHHNNDDQWHNSGTLAWRSSNGVADGIVSLSHRQGNDLTRADGSRIPYSANPQTSYLLKNNFYFGNHRLQFSAVVGRHKAWEPFAAKRDDVRAPSVADIAKYGEDWAWKRRLLYRNQKDESYTLKYYFTPENPLFDLQASLSYSQTKQHDKRPPHALGASMATMGNESHIAYQDWFLDVHNTSRFQTNALKHALTVGIQSLRHQRDVWIYDQSSQKRADRNFGYYTPPFMPSGEQQQNSLYIRDEIKWGNFSLTPAIRYDHVRNQGQANLASLYNNKAAGHDYSSKSYRFWSPFLELTWQPTKYALLFAGVARTWRAPVIDEQYEVQAGNTSIAGSSRSLKAERLDSLRLGSIIQFNRLFHEQDQLQWRTTLFDLRGKNEIFKTRGIACYEQTTTGGSVEETCAKPVANYRNLPAYHIQGLETEIYYDHPYWFASLSHAIMRGKRNGSPRNPWFEKDTWLTDIPPNRTTVSLGFKIPSMGVMAGWRSEFVQRKDRSPLDADPDAGYWALPKSEAYQLHGLFASYQPHKNLNFRLSIDNIFNQEYKMYLGENIYGVGRNVKMGMTLRF